MTITEASKHEILRAVRRNRPVERDLPEAVHKWTTYADPRAKFAEVLELVGGSTIVARDAADLNQQLSHLPQFANAAQIVSLVPGIARSTVDVSIIDSPHDFAGVDIAILPGEFAVAENAAVWVTDEHVPIRVLYFLCQHLVLVTPVNQIIDHMHAAYERLRQAFVTPRFGAFISGPSKTADIEQTLVVGAHGPRSLVVCFLESEP